MRRMLELFGQEIIHFIAFVVLILGLFLHCQDSGSSNLTRALYIMQ